MDNHDVDRYVEHLQRRREVPAQAIIAATALGREASLLRQELDKPVPSTLGPGEANTALEALTATLSDMNVSPQQRAAAAWALGQIGGLQPCRELLNRLEDLLVGRRPTLSPAHQAGQEEVKDVYATLVQALAQALDELAAHALNRYDLQRLRQVCKALLDYLFKETDPDLSTALAMSLAKLALRVPTDILQDTLHDLLNAPEPLATLAAVGVLSELISAKQQDKILDYLYHMQPDAILDDVFDELASERGRSYSLEERRRLFQLAAQFHYTEQVTRTAGDYMWQEIEQDLLKKGES